MPFYEFEFDMGVYGFIGNNGIKIICLKKIENNVQETSSDIKLKQVNLFLLIFHKISKEIYSKFVKLQLNPFYDKKEFFKEKSLLRENFANVIINLVKQNQIL